MLLSIKNAYYKYTDKPILNDASLFINENDKIGVIGVNGIGKSTLFKILCKNEPITGSYYINPNCKIGYLEQNPIFKKGITIYESIFPTLDDTTKRYEAESILTKLGIKDFSLCIDFLSGGERKKIALAKTLVNKNNLLILDEPSNHLDSYMISFLEKYLKNYKGAIIMITHDRYFLERVCKKIIELDDGKLYSYEANYEKYLEIKKAREINWQITNEKRKAFLKREKYWVSRGALARTTKSKFRLLRYEEIKKQIENKQNKSLKIEGAISRLGTKTIEAVNISYEINNRVLFSNFSYLVLRNDRLGIVGENGAGKSTLLRLFAKELVPQNGDIIFGSTVKIGFFKQEFDEVDLDKRVIDYLKEINEDILTEEGYISKSEMLEMFLFDKSMQSMFLKNLSGGQRRRLHLLKVLMQAPNILLLDEPTNDLDISTLEILEDYLDKYKGAVITVSHDRYFLDKTCDHIIEIKDGIITEYLGGYSDYFKSSINTKPEEVKSSVKITNHEIKLSYNEQREYNEISLNIDLYEKKLNEIEKDLVKYANDYTKLCDIIKEKDVIEKKLEPLYERWIYLSEKKEGKK